MTIRVAKISDLPQLLSWAEKFQSKTQWRDEPLDGDELRNWLSAHLKRSDRIILVDERGAMGAAIAPKLPFTRSRFADETFWFSEGSGVKVFLAMRKWAAARDAKLRIFTLPSTPEKIEGFLARQGYSLAQRAWQEGI